MLQNHSKRNNALYSNNELVSKFNTYHRKQYSGIVSSILKDGDLQSLSQSITAPINSSKGGGLVAGNSGEKLKGKLAP